MDDQAYMRIAMNEARQAAAEDEVPIGCVIVSKDGDILARDHNRKEALKTATGHAEILAINAASHRIGNWHLNDCTLYVTLEPCMMCSGAIYQSRIGKVVIGARDSRWPGLVTFLNDYPLNHQPEIEFSELGEECLTILQDYFHQKRRKS